MPENVKIEIVPGTNLRTTPTVTSDDNIYGVTPAQPVVVDAQLTAETEGFAWWLIELPAPAFVGERRMRNYPPLYVRDDRARMLGNLPSDGAGATPTGASTPAGMIGAHPALPSLPMHQRMGMHMLEAGKPQLDDYLAANCRSFTVLNNVAAAREARDVGAAVIFRRFIDHGVVPDPVEFARTIGLGAGDAVMVMGINEADNIATSDLVRRFDWDKRFAEAVWQLYPRCFPLIGSFSMGTPQLENGDVARVWRETYGAFLNQNWQRVGLNYHSYSARPAAGYPPQNVEVIEPKWLEMRHLLFGYDPALGGLDKRVVLASDESGVDVGSVGGFGACGYTGDGLLRWWRLRRELFEAHAQQYVFNLFQADTHNARWAGYNTRPFLGSLTQIWTDRIGRSLELDRAFKPVDRAVSPLPANWSPPSKRIVA